MPAIFPRWTNNIPIAIGVLAPLVGAGLVFAVWYWFSPSYTDVGYRPEQPVPYSHKLHAGDMGIDCRYCHNTVEQAAHAAIPPTATCMNCHEQVKADSQRLRKVRESYATGEPIPDNYPVFGRDAFRTATGVHAAAVVKAFHKGNEELADTVYSGVPARLVGRAQQIEIGPMSGKSNVVFWLERHGVRPDEELVERIFRRAKASATVLTEHEILREIENARIYATTRLDA